MFPTFLQYSDIGLLVLRVAVGVIFLAHGIAKLKNSKSMAQGMGWSAEAVLFLGAVETAGGALIVLGLQTQLAALVLGVIMLGALYHKKFKWHKKFMGDGGWELDFVILAATILLFVSSAGAWSL